MAIEATDAGGEVGDVETATCAYCSREVCAHEDVPALDDDTEWTSRAEEHAADCEWIATRAHRRDVPLAAQHIAAQAKESAAELLRQGWTAYGSAYDLGVYTGDRDALEARLSRPATVDERRALTYAIRERLDEGRPVTSTRPL